MSAPRANGWPVASGVPALARGQVHVWRVRLDDDVPRLDRLRQVLDPTEQERARRFRHDLHRDRFIVRRAALRLLLGRYLRCDPAALLFEHVRSGKPVLAATDAAPDLRFNISDSAGLALLAFTIGRDLGVDLERIRAGPADEAISRRFFAAEEHAALMALAPSQRRAAFFRCWTRKEAYLKARGDGLTMGLNRFAVSLGPGDAPVLLRSDEGPAETERWSMLELCPEVDYVGCLTVEGRDWTVHTWSWEVQPGEGW